MISQDIERELIKDSGHEMGCWEEWIEVAIEKLAERGMIFEGNHTEVHPDTQMTMMDMFYARADRECYCRTEPEDAEIIDPNDLVEEP